MTEVLLKKEQVKAGLEFIKEDAMQTLDEQKKICQIPAPTFKEHKRAQYYYELLNDLGLDEVKIDSAGNVIGVLNGYGTGPKIMTMAHIDTVFPEDTDVTVYEKEGILYAPGLADNTRSLAAQLSVIRAIKQSGIKLKGDIVFTANVCEEGLGDLKGAKALFENYQDIDASVAIDGTAMGTGGIIFDATGSKRYEISFHGKGGHSFNAFGKPSAIHALGRAIAKISDIQVPEEPKTTFNVGVISGGTSVNTIAGEAKMLVDMRSNDAGALAKLEKTVMNHVEDAKREENSRWDKEEIGVEKVLVGDRPAGSQKAEDAIVQKALEATKAVGIEPELIGAGSTDSNIPISMGIPAITVSGGGRAGSIHSKDEWFDPQDGYLGVQRIFLLLLSLAEIIE